MLPLVMNILEPLITYWSPCRSAVVRMEAASDPEFGSESPQQPSFSPRSAGTRNSRFCSSVPKRSRGMHPEPDVREERGREAAVDARDLLDQQAAHHHVAAAAAVLLRIADAEIAEAAELAEQVERKGLGALELLDPRRERALGEAADGGAKRLLFLVQGEAEHAESSGRGPYQGDSIAATGARVTAQSASASSHSTSGAARFVCRTSQSTRPDWTSNARGGSGNVTISPLRFSKSARG